MSDDTLRAIYDARVTNNAPIDRVQCPLPEQLQVLAESGKGGTPPNLALLDHVFGCAYCRMEFAMLRAVQKEFEAAHDVTPAKVKAASRWFSGPRLAVAAAVLVAVAIGGESLRRMNGASADSTLRNVNGDASDVMVVAPTKNDVFPNDAPFVWRAVSGAVTYEIQVLDTTGVALVSHVTADTVFRPTAEDRAKLSAAAMVDWFVAARRSDGNERRSAVTRIRVTERR